MTQIKIGNFIKTLRRDKVKLASCCGGRTSRRCFYIAIVENFFGAWYNITSKIFEGTRHERRKEKQLL